MEIKLTLNGRAVTASVQADTLLLDFLRSQGCLSVKRGCETANCGLCTVLLDEKPVLSCSVLAARADGHAVHTLEGLQEPSTPWRAFRRRRPISPPSSPARGRSSAASVTRAL